MALPQPPPPPLYLLVRSPRTVLRPPAAFRDRCHSALAIPFQPLIPHRTRDPELPAQLRQRLLSPIRRHHKPHSLLSHVHRFPRHPSPSPLRGRGECKGCLGTPCKECHGTEQSFARSGDFAHDRSTPTRKLPSR